MPSNQFYWFFLNHFSLFLNRFQDFKDMGIEKL
jgi:hypothetical protein